MQNRGVLAKESMSVSLAPMSRDSLMYASGKLTVRALVWMAVVLAALQPVFAGSCRCNPGRAQGHDLKRQPRGAHAKSCCRGRGDRHCCMVEVGHNQCRSRAVGLTAAPPHSNCACHGICICGRGDDLPAPLRSSTGYEDRTVEELPLSVAAGPLVADARPSANSFLNRQPLPLGTAAEHCVSLCRFRC